MKKVIIAVIALLALTTGVWAMDCVEVDIEAPDTAYIGQRVTLSGEVTNCGTQAGLVEIKGILRKDEVTIESRKVTFYLAAGETKSASVTVVIPEDPSYIGTYSACVEARIGTATDSDCTTMVVLGHFSPSTKVKRIGR